MTEAPLRPFALAALNPGSEAHSSRELTNRDRTITYRTLDREDRASPQHWITLYDGSAALPAAGLLSLLTALMCKLSDFSGRLFLGAGRTCRRSVDTPKPRGPPVKPWINDPF